MSAYNLKKIEYEGFIQFRIYKRPILVEDSETNINEKIKDEYRQQELLQEGKKEDNEKDAVKSAKEKNAHSEKVSINRTVQNIYDYTLNNKWDWFVTLTFNPEEVDSSNYDVVMKKACNWCKNMRNRYSPDMKYVLIPERHKSGTWHIHGLLAECGKLNYIDSGRVAIGKKAYLRTEKNIDKSWIYNIEQWRNGWSTATKVGSSVKCASYVTKYITKELIVQIPNKRRFYPSNNLKKSIQTTYNLPYEEIQDLINSYEIDYIKQQDIPEAGQSIQYITVKL